MLQNFKKRNGKVVYKRCQNNKGSCPSKHIRKCKKTKIGSCKFHSCCTFHFNYRKGIWVKNKRTCKTSKFCGGSVVHCRRIKLINNCYKSKCLHLQFKNNKNCFKKMFLKSEKKCIPVKITRCKRRHVIGSKCYYDNCCKTIYFNGRTVSRSCTKHNQNCPLTVNESCKKIKNKKGTCVTTRCCRESKREGKVVTNSCYNKKN